MKFITLGFDHPLRERVEACIRNVYSSEYGATLGGLPETLVALIDRQGEPICAAGLRLSGDGFFSERYLSSAIDGTLGAVWTGPVERRQIAEISCLAASKPGTSLLLFRHIVGSFRSMGIPWAFFTATDRLRAVLRRCGVPFIDIASASDSQVDNPDDWGSYYMTDPRVVAVHDSMLTLVPQTETDIGTAVGA